MLITCLVVDCIYNYSLYTELFPLRWPTHYEPYIKTKVIETSMIIYVDKSTVMPSLNAVG